MCKYYGYIRVSTETQSEKGYGLDTQRNEINKYAAANGITISKVYEDAGITANIHDDADDDALLKRQALMELLSDIDAGDTVIVMNTSRLWRSDMTKVLVRREMMKHKANIISIEQPKYNLYSKDPNEYLVNSIMEIIDVYDRMSIALKLARGRSMKAHKGDKPAGVCPLGYKYSADKKSIEINREEAAIVKRIFSELTKTKNPKSLQQIADELNAEGITTRNGKAWGRSSLHAITKNRFYIGELEHAGQSIQGNHEPLITKNQFGKANAALKRRHK